MKTLMFNLALIQSDPIASANLSAVGAMIVAVLALVGLIFSTGANYAKLKWLEENAVTKADMNAMNTLIQSKASSLDCQKSEAARDLEMQKHEGRIANIERMVFNQGTD